MSNNPTSSSGISLKEMISKTNLANIAAFVIVLAGVGYGIFTKDTETVKTFTLMGIGYLFGKATK